ncbi:MAG: shikimate kinase [Verrucomicrobia bacterium]|nr:shikimate kinase [Verrucomicrobiota bacterium]
MNIILIGFMGSGKSTVGKHLSELLQRPLIEMDHLVLQKTDCQTVREVFAKGGELLWRDTEIAVAKELHGTTGKIISTGGGVVLNKIILDYLSGKRIYLKTSFDTLAKRVAEDPDRPLFQKTHYDFRLPLYHHYADEVIDTDSYLPAEIALKIQERLNSAHGL